MSKAFNECFKTANCGELRDIKTSFVPCFVIQMDNASSKNGFRYVTAERYIDGNYQKFNDNTGNVASEDVKQQTADYAAAFSHFSFVHSKGQDICVDIQGVDLQWTDPQLHSRDQEY